MSVLFLSLAHSTKSFLLAPTRADRSLTNTARGSAVFLAATIMLLLLAASPGLVPTGGVRARHRLKRACARHGSIVGYCGTVDGLAPQRACARLGPLSMSEDHYATLGLDRETTTAQVKEAYRKLALRMHPDVNDAPEAEELFASLTEAYSVLGDAKLRATYDKTIGRSSSAVENSYDYSQNYDYDYGNSSPGGGGGFWVNSDSWDEPDAEWKTQETGYSGLDDYDELSLDGDGLFFASIAIFCLVVSWLGAQGEPSAMQPVEWCGLLSCAGMEDAGFGPLM